MNKNTKEPLLPLKKADISDINAQVLKTNKLYEKLNETLLAISE